MQMQVEIMKAPSGTECLLIATFLPLRRFRDFPAFFLMNRRIERQLKRTQGIVRYGLKADLVRKSFWTCSVWVNKSSVDQFVGSEPHATAVQRFKNWTGPGAAFVEWRSSSPSIDWHEALERLRQPTFRYS
jgi:hypothetical protein